MFLHNDVVANRKSLAGALSNLFSREERVEDSGLDSERDTSPVVLDFYLNIFADLSGANGELSTVAGLFLRGLTDSVRSVYDEVQKNLVHLVGVAFEARQVGLIVSFNICDMLDLVLGDRESCVERFVEVDLFSFSTTGVGETPHGTEDLAHAPESGGGPWRRRAGSTRR